MDTSECDISFRSVVLYYVRIKTENTDWSDRRWRYGGILATPPAPPTGFEADGDSRGISVPEGPGISEITWSRVSGATSYEVRYVCYEHTANDTDIEPCDPNSNNWPIKTVTTTSTTLTGLTSETLYRIRVRTVDSGVTSGWDVSDPVYTYPTTVPPLTGKVVATQGLGGYRPNGEYSYTICKESLPVDTTDRSRWINDIRAGIKTWKTATDVGLAVRHGTNDSCHANSVVNNTIYRVNREVMQSVCRPSAIGCAWPIMEVRTVTNIYLRDSLDHGENCSALHSTAAHEAGHAYGLSGDHSDLSRSIMAGLINISTDITASYLCGPQAPDVVAMEAIYQSRDLE